MEEEPLMSPADILYDGLYYIQKCSPRLVGGKWPLSASLLPDNTQVTQINVPPPSVSRALLEFTSRDAMRLDLPITYEQPIIVNTMNEIWKQTLSNGTRCAELNMSVPISTVEHENTQLQWNRVSKTATSTAVPTCKYGPECDACFLENSPGPLQVYLSVECQDQFDQTGKNNPKLLMGSVTCLLVNAYFLTGTVPEEAMFCLLCIRRGNSCAHSVDINNCFNNINCETQTPRLCT